MYCNTYPIVLGVKYFSTFNETLEYFKDVWIPASQEEFFIFKNSPNLPLFYVKKHYMSIRGVKKNDLKKGGDVERIFKDDKSLLFLYFIKQKNPLTNSH